MDGGVLRDVPGVEGLVEDGGLVIAVHDQDLQKS